MASRRFNELKNAKVNNRKEKPGSTKKAARPGTVIFNGWDLPVLNDENDIVSWMKREQNGDNKRKPRPNEEMPEEGYRHDFLRCRCVENQMEFERESLHERYRKNCQVGARPTETMASSSLKKLNEGELDDLLPARKLRFPRSCKSAELPATPKISTMQQVGLGFPDSKNPQATLILSRSHSVIDDAKLKSFGLTLPPDEKTLKLLELAEKFTAKADLGMVKGKTQKSAAFEETMDEGYDSKVSSNDNEADDETDVSKVVNHDGSSIYTNLDSIVHDQGTVDTTDVQSNREDEDGEGNDFFPMGAKSRNNMDATLNGLGSNVPISQQKDAIAKLIYSRRDLNVYERSPSRRKDTSFRYAGKEQSRLMETSLNNITPGYLNMQQLANLTSLSQNPLSQINIDSQNQLQLLYKHYAQQHSMPPHHHNHHQQHLQHHNNNNNNNVNCNNPSQQNSNQTSNSHQPQNTHQMLHNIDLKQVCVGRISLQDSKGYSSDHPKPQIHFDHHKASFSNNAHLGSSQTTNHKRINSSGSVKREPFVDHEMNPAIVSPRVIGAPNVEGKDFKTRLDASNKSNAIRVQDMSSKIEIPNNNRTTPLNNNIVNSNDIVKPVEKEGSRESPDNAHSTQNKSPMDSPKQNNFSNYPAHMSSILMKYYNKNSPLHANTTMTSDGQRQHHDNDLSSRSHDVSGHTSDRTPGTTFFPVADLLPAVESNLRRRKKRGFGKHLLMYRSHTVLDSNIWKKDSPINTNGADMPPATSSYQDLSNNTLSPTGMGFDDVTSGLRGDKHGLIQKGYGPPKFRPHHALSPLQRAKEIATRRIHGNVTKYTDGTETVTVTSPQYIASKMERINSASRTLGRILNGTWKTS